MTKKRVRSVPIYVWVRPDELEVIRERMAEAGIRNMSAYIRKMALGGYVLHVDLEPVLSFLLSLSAGLLSILASVLGLLSVLMLFVEKDISTGIAGLLMAFAISPFGLPALAGWLLAKLDELNGSLRGFIMG